MGIGHGGNEGEFRKMLLEPQLSLFLLSSSEMVATRDFDFGPIQFLNFRMGHRIFSCFRHTHLVLPG